MQIQVCDNVRSDANMWQCEVWHKSVTVRGMAQICDSVKYGTNLWQCEIWHKSVTVWGMAQVCDNVMHGATITGTRCWNLALVMIGVITSVVWLNNKTILPVNLLSGRTRKWVYGSVFSVWESQRLSSSSQLHIRNWLLNVPKNGKWLFYSLY